MRLDDFAANPPRLHSREEVILKSVMELLCIQQSKISDYDNR